MSKPIQILDESFFQRSTQTVAKELIGKVISLPCPRLGQTVSGRIVETEAYLGLSDPACHSFHGKRTPRTECFYKMGGHIYVYLIYGMYNCLNFVTRHEEPEAVLIRALEPMDGYLELMSLENKKRSSELLNGPGKLCRAFGIDRKINGMPLSKAPLNVIDDGFKASRSRIVSCPRVGVDYAKEAALWNLRYLLKDSPHLSKKPNK